MTKSKKLSKAEEKKDIEKGFNTLEKILGVCIILCIIAIGLSTYIEIHNKNIKEEIINEIIFNDITKEEALIYCLDNIKTKNKLLFCVEFILLIDTKTLNEVLKNE